MKISLVPTVDQIVEEDLEDKTVVIIDVLRATSVIVTALSNGAKEVIPKLEVEEAIELSREYRNCILGGERKALKIEGFDLTNSPLEYSKEAVEDKTIILSTTNGTKAIHRARGAEKVIIGCMLNGKAIADRITAEACDTVIICAGTYGRFSLDDFICAGKIIFEVLNGVDIELEDFAATAYMAYRDNKCDVLSYVSRASHYKYLLSIGLEEDIKYCFTEDIFNLVPVASEGNNQITISI